MRQSRIVARIMVVVAGAMLAASVACAGLYGVVTAVSKSTVTVSGAAYDLEDTTAIQDLTGHPITRPELRPGVNVELEFDAEGKLTLIRAAVVR